MIELPELAAELVRLKVDVILAASTPVAHSTTEATSAIPVVMVVADPIGNPGRFRSWVKPGGNLPMDYRISMVI